LKDLKTVTGWCFGTWLLFLHSVGKFIIPVDFQVPTRKRRVALHRGQFLALKPAGDGAGSGQVNFVLGDWELQVRTSHEIIPKHVKTDHGHVYMGRSS